MHAYEKAGVILLRFSSDQFSHSVVSDSLWPHGLQQASLYITSFQSFLKLMSIKSVMPSNHPILCHPLNFLPSVFPSTIIVFIELAFHIRWSKYWSISFSNQSFQWIFRVVFLWDLLVWSPHSPRDSQEFSLAPQSQGTLKSFLQHHHPKASIFWCSSLMVQLSHPYMTTGETLSLTLWTFVGTVMSLLFQYAV